MQAGIWLECDRHRLRGHTKLHQRASTHLSPSATHWSFLATGKASEVGRVESALYLEGAGTVSCHYHRRTHPDQVDPRSPATRTTGWVTARVGYGRDRRSEQVDHLRTSRSSLSYCATGSESRHDANLR